MKRFGIGIFFASMAAAAVIAILTPARHQAVQTVHAAEGNPAAVTIDYPLNGSVFPPEITPPTFIWRDASEAANLWRIDVTFGDGSPGMRLDSRGDRLNVGEIDPRHLPKQRIAQTYP